MDLEGDSSGLGQGMRTGLEAAFKDQKIDGKTIEFIALNDYYNPETTIQATQELVAQGIFAMVGNVGTPTAKVALPILADNGVPAVGFFTGAGLLRPGVGDIINYRASYVQETTAVIKAALQAGVQPDQICAYVQNDAYGMAGIAGVKAALNQYSETDHLVTLLDEIMAAPGDNPVRNFIGPVGVYTRNTLKSKEGYDSLKEWEAIIGKPCSIVVTVGTYTAVGRFIAYARKKNENWLFSAVSFTGADNLRNTLADYAINDRVIVTEVVPDINADLPIVAEARKALGEQINNISLEGYIAGKMFLQIMGTIEGEISRDKFLQAMRGKQFELGGLLLDFTNDNQASDLVSMTYLDNGQYSVISSESLSPLLVN